MHTKLDALLQFVSCTNTFRAIERTVSIQQSTRPENDLEHTGQLALLAWYVLSNSNNSLNLDLALRYALVHDLVEVHAGDTSFYDTEARKDKKEREARALVQLKEEYPHFSDLTDHISHYELRSDPESVFIHALDKLIPVLNIYLSGGAAWKLHGISLAQLLANKEPAIGNEPLVGPLFGELAERLREQQAQLFA